MWIETQTISPFFCLIEVEMIPNAMLVSGVQQSVSVWCVHIHTHICMHTYAHTHIYTHIYTLYVLYRNIIETTL